MIYGQDDEQKVKTWHAEIQSILAEYDWESSFILKTCKKKLEELSTQLSTYLEECEAQKHDRVAPGLKDWEGYVPVYITLYSSLGGDINQWRVLLQGIKDGSAGRPIYRQEADARAAVDAKTSSLNEGYAKLYIKEEDVVVMPVAKVPHDKRGVELLILRPKSVRPDHIVKFVHANQTVYSFSGGELNLV